jgi:hypothetical protein
VEPLECRHLLSAVPSGPELQVHTYTTSDQMYPAIATDDSGDYVIAWTSYGQDGDGYGIYAQRFDAAGAPVGGEFAVNTTTTGDQTLAGVAMDSDGDFVITWTSNGQDGSGDGVFAQRYDSAGMAQGGELPINTFTAGNQFGRAVAMDDDGNFTVVWTSDGEDGDDYGVFARQYDSGGTPLAGAFQVNTYTTGKQWAPDVAVDADGDFVVVWMSELQDGSEYGVYAQRYNAAGVAQGGELQVNTYTSTTQQFPLVAMDSDGDFVVAWESYGQDGNGYGVYARRYNAAGAPQGAEFRANSYTAGVQWYTDIAMADDGDFVIVWESDGQDGDGAGIYLQSFNALGSPRGAEQRVNSYTADSQLYPVVAVDADGDARVAWMSFGQDGDGYGVYSQRFEVVPDVVGRKVFYNQSKFDGNTSLISTSDDGAIAPDKSAYLPGSGTATFANITSYSRGINGVMVDIDGPTGALTAADFTFRMSAQVGANNTPSTWTAAPAPIAFSVRPGAGVDGSDRVVIVWANGAIANRWLEVIVEGNDAAGGFNTNTGLAESDLFFFGNRIGDTGSGTATLAVTSALDELAARGNSGAGATITNLFDFDRSGLVSAVDNLISRNNIGTLTKINLSDPPAAPASSDAAIALALAAATGESIAPAPSTVLPTPAAVPSAESAVTAAAATPADADAGDAIARASTGSASFDFELLGDLLDEL